MEQDPRFAEKQKKLLQSTKFPSIFQERVAMKKVALDVIKPWIESRINEYLGFDDDVLSEYVVSLLDDQNGTKPIDPRVVQLNLSGFMEDHAPAFTERLWRLLLSAQNEVGGIPTEILEAKKAELRAQQLEQKRILPQTTATANSANANTNVNTRAPIRYLGASKREMEEGGRRRNRSRSPTKK